MVILFECIFNDNVKLLISKFSYDDGTWHINGIPNQVLE